MTQTQRQEKDKMTHTCEFGANLLRSNVADIGGMRIRYRLYRQCRAAKACFTVSVTTAGEHTARTVECGGRDAMQLYENILRGGVTPITLSCIIDDWEAERREV